ncbi:hypothetical protein QPK31_15185 [Massilia sp. YIM B02769]|uniref:hypothetical protein n=1 Tax=Massilia sp. YIM B02769 TaxID=3050129 RepID=UPI0025B6711F|nr:hypothetical protein [Massilia sp. YIM B02769]MDN4059569.1 hypothetical protein [Massilia sp. YIM B02769]
MIDITLTNYRIAAGAAALALVLAGAAAAGAVVNGWRLDGVHQRAMAVEKGGRVAAEKLLAEQSAAIEKLGAEKRAADERRQVAEKFAASAIARTRNRGAAVTASQAPDCSGVMREAWEGWR